MQKFTPQKFMIRKVLIPLLFSFGLFFKSCKTTEQSDLSDTQTKASEIVDSDWLYWRGSEGTGVSTQTGLPNDLNASALWTYEIEWGRASNRRWTRLSVWILRSGR